MKRLDKAEELIEMLDNELGICNAQNKILRKRVAALVRACEHYWVNDAYGGHDREGYDNIHTFLRCTRCGKVKS
jgi:hypothetical protein